MTTDARKSIEETALAEAEAAYARHDLRACCAAASRVFLSPTGDAGDAVERSRVARAGFLRAHCLYRLGDFAALLAHGPQAVSALARVEDPESACQVLRWMALGAPEIGRFTEGIQAAQQGLRVADAAKLYGARVMLMNALAANFERMGDPWQADRLLADALAMAEQRCGDVERFVTLNNMCAVALTTFYLLRDGADQVEAAAALQRALAHAREAEPLAERIGDPFYRVYIESNLGDILNFLGKHEKAERWLGSALQRAQAHGFETLVWRVQCSLGELALERGDPATARDLLQPLVPTMGPDAPHVTALRLHGALYRALRELGDVAGALEHFELHYRLQRLRSVAQLRGQAQNLVTRVEVEQARRDASSHLQRAAVLEQIAERDPLTGLVNRRGLERYLGELSRAAGPPRPIVVAVVDIDLFKAVNDRYGHAAGDAVLVQLAQLLRDHMRPGDLMVRLGGDEFLAVWTDMDVEQAGEVAQRLRQAAAGRSWKGVPAALHVTLSIGLAALPMPAHSLGDLLQAADRAMYVAKHLGRDRVEIAAGP